MSRKAEFLAAIKPYVDKDSKREAKQDTIDLAKELSDVLSEINVKADGSDFKELKEAFNEQLTIMGKQPIIFSDNTLKGITAQFANAISEGIKTGVAEGGSSIDTINIEKDYNSLLKKRRQKVDELKKLSKKQRIREDQENRLKLFDIRTSDRISFENDDELKKKVQEIWRVFEDINFELQDAEEANNITEQLLTRWKNAAIEMVKAKNTITDLTYQTIEKTKELDEIFAKRDLITKAEDIFGKRTVEYFVNQDDEEGLSLDLEYGSSMFENFIDSDDVAENIDVVRNEIAKLDIQISALMQKHPELINKEDALKAEERLKKIQEAYSRVLYTTGQKKGTVNERSKRAIESALEYVPKSSKVPILTKNMSDAQLMQSEEKEQTARSALDTLANQYIASDGKSWEQLAQVLIKFVKEYKALSENPTISKVSKDLLKGWEDLYGELSPMFSEAEAMLRDVISLANGDKISQPIVNNATKLAEINKASTNIFEQEKKAGEDRQRAQTNEKAAEDDLTNKEKERLGIAYSITDAYDEQYRLKAKQGEKIEVAATADSKTGKINQVVRGDQNSTAIPNSSVSDVGIHSHWTRVAAPSPLVKGVTKTGDLRYFRDELSDKSLFLIRAMEEAVLLDFSQISEEALNLLISDYDAAGAQIAQQWESMSLGDKLKKFGSLDESAEAMQVALKEAFLNIVSQYKGFATYIQKPMWPIQEPTRDDRRKKLVKQLDSYDDNVLDSQTADEYIEKRKEIFELLQKEGLLTDEIKTKYDEVNKKLQTRADLIREAEDYYDDIKGILGDQQVGAIDSEEQYRRDHLDPFDAVVDKMRKSGLFSEEELEDSFYKILDAMESKAQDIGIKSAYNELDNRTVNPEDITDIQELNRLLKEREDIISRAGDFYLKQYDEDAYEEAIKLNQAIKNRIAFLQQPRSDTTGETEVAANQKKIESYEDLLAIVQKYYNLKSKLRSINSDYPDGIDAQDYNPPIRAEMDSIEKILESKQINKEVLSVFEALNSDYSIDEALQKIANALGIKIPQAARVAEDAVGDLNSELRDGQKLMLQTSGPSATTGTGDASSEELKSLQDKNEQLRKEKESAEKDKKAANDRANEAEAEAERLRNELANRDKVDSEKSPSGATSIDTSELEGLLGRVTYKVKFEGESPLDNSAGVLEAVKSALSNIQINASTDKDAPWAREATLNGVIKNLLESIKSNTTNINEALKNVSIGPKSESKENDNIVVAKDSKNTKNKHGSISHGKADGESNSPQKILDYYYWLEEQMEQFKNNTMYYNALKETYDSITPKINKLIEDVLTEAEEKYGPDKNPPWLDSLIEKHELHMAKIKGGEEYSDSTSKEKKALDILNEEYRLKSEIFNLEQKGATQNDLAPLYEKLGIYESIRSAIENSMDDGELTRYAVQAANVQNKGETKLTAAEIKANIKTRAEEAKKAAQSVKEEAAVVKELDELYQQLAQAKAMADAETDSVLRRPYEDRVNQLQSEIDAKEANIDRTKYSQQFDNTQKESYKKQIVEELIDLYTKLGEAEAKEDRMSIGNATAQQYQNEMDALYKRIEATQKLIDVNEELQNQFDAARKAAIDKVVSKADKADAVSDDKNFEKLGKQYEKLGKLRAQVQSTGSVVTQEDARQLEEAIKKEQERLVLSKEQTEELERRLEVARQNELLRQNSIKQQKSFEQQIKDSRNKARLNNVNSVVRTSQDVLNNAMTIEGLSPESINKIKEFSIEIDKLQNKYAEINAKGGVVSDKDQKDVVNQIANVKKLSSEINDLVKEYNNMSDDNAKTIGKFNGQLNGASIDEYKRQLKEAVMAATNGKASIKGFDAETKTLSYSLKTGSHEFTNYTAAVRGADGALVSIQKETKRTETFIESITRKTKEIGTYLISSLSLYDIINKFRQGIQYVREIDSALTELKKVTDETEETYERFLDTASKTADKVGSTIKEIVSSTADWSRLGYSMEDAANLAESTSVLLNVSEFSSIDDATSALISTMQAFGYAAKDSMHVVDVLNEVGNNFAISSDGIATALQDSASALMAANNSYEEAVALIAAANRVNF